MKKKYFYSHLVETSSITLELADMELTTEERLELISLVESNIHNKVLDTVLSKLSEHDKKIFLLNLHANNHQKTWEHLKEKLEDIEEKIKKEIFNLKKELEKDILETKQLK